MITEICIIRVLCDQCSTAHAEFAAPTWNECRRAAQAEGWHIEIYVSQWLCFCPACRPHRQPPAGSLWAIWQAGEDFLSPEEIARCEAKVERHMMAQWQLARDMHSMRNGTAGYK